MFAGIYEARAQIGAVLLIVAMASAVAAESPLPFTPAFAADVESSLFSAGAVSTPKLEALRANLQQRRDEAAAVFAADQRARGRKKKAALRKAQSKKLVQLYDVLLGSEGEIGWLDQLAATSDPTEARRLAGRILEFDRALLVSGALPGSLSIPENLAAISVLEWQIPGSTKARHVDREAANLVDPRTGLYLEPAELRQILDDGGDLSRLGPAADSTFWVDRGRIADVDVASAYYGAGAPAHEGLSLPFPTRGSLDRIKKSQTKPKFEIEVSQEGVDHEYKLKVGGEIHSEPVVGAILATLGFNADVVKHVKNFRVDLGDNSVEELRNEWRSYFEFKRVHLSYRFDDYFDVVEDAEGRAIVAKEATLTAKPNEIERVGPWPWGANGNEGIREARALGIISIWLANTDVKEAENNKILLRERPDGSREIFHLLHDAGHAFGRVISEQVDAYPWDIGRRTLTGDIEFNYHATWASSLRHQITYADARWATRLIAQLTREQIETAVGFGSWPEPVAKLLVEKLINRRNQLVKLMGLEGEESASGPIAMLEVDREISTADGAVVDGELLQSVFDGATQEYDNYWEEFLGPVWELAKLQGAGVFQKTIGLVPALIFDTDSVGLSRFIVLELLITLRRDVEENPRPTGAGDYFLVRDQMLLGLRVGGGLIGTGTTSYYRSYTLVQPAGTLRDATYAGDTILSVRMPYHVWKGNLPDDFVLLRESFVDVRANVMTEDVGGSIPPIGATAGVGLARLSRDVVSRKDGRLMAYDDKSVYLDQDFEAFVNALFVRIPFIRQGYEKGGLDGRHYTLPDAFGADEGEESDALSRLIRDGDFSGIAARADGVDVASRFSDSFAWARIPFVFQRTGASRTDRVVLGDGDTREAFVQRRVSRGGFWAFLDWGEDHLHTVRALARAKDPAAAVDPKRLGKLETPRMISTYFMRDRNTFDGELAEYVDFVNGLDVESERLIDFTPGLHSANHRWGDLGTSVRLGYSKKAVKRLRSISRDELWAELERSFDASPGEFARHRDRMATWGKWRLAEEAKVPRRFRQPMRVAKHVALKLKRARAEGDTKDWMEDVMAALSKASFRRAGSYDSAVLGALHRLLEDEDDVSIEAVIEPLPWIENRMVGKVPLVAKTKKKRHRLHRRYIDFDPECTAGLYAMLDTFEPKHPSDEYYGSVCDGADGAR